MSIASLGTTQASHSIFAAATAASQTSAAPGAFGGALAGAFGTQLQSLLAGQSGTGSSAAQTAYQTEPGRGAPGGVHHHDGHHAAGTDANAADGMDNGQTAPTAQNGTNGTSTPGSTGQQGPGGVLLSDLMRGLQAYGATTTLM
jgi:hypothetical protein